MFELWTKFCGVTIKSDRHSSNVRFLFQWNLGYSSKSEKNTFFGVEGVCVYFQLKNGLLLVAVFSFPFMNIVMKCCFILNI